MTDPQATPAAGSIGGNVIARPQGESARLRKSELLFPAMTDGTPEVARNQNYNN
jgi:hypothetical protein